VARLGRYHPGVIVPLLLLLLFAPASMPATAPSDRAGGERVIGDFEAGDPSVAGRLDARVIDDASAAAQGRRYLRLAVPEGSRGGVIRFTLDARDDVSHHAALAFAVRADAAASLRWLALDERGRPIFQRRVPLEPADDWQRIVEPLALWRWDNARVGAWSEVRAIALRIESSGAGLSLDDVRLLPGARGGASAEPTAADLLRLAFPGRPVRTSGDDTLLVATDQLDRFTQGDLDALHDDLVRARALLRRAFADAIRPLPARTPAMLLIFDTPASERRFYERLGDRWRATIEPPRLGGYTLQDIATSSWSDTHGVRRPVYLHEGVHALMARELRLQSGHGPHRWLHEGVASYVQASVHPTSLPRRALAERLAADLDPAGRVGFVPLATLLNGVIDERHYAQLATLAAYLIEQDPPLLAAVARGLADGEPLEAILQRAGTSLPRLQQQWLAWSRATWPPGDIAHPAFPRPREWD
jgi:hypothetical protein